MGYDILLVFEQETKLSINDWKVKKRTKVPSLQSADKESILKGGKMKKKSRKNPTKGPPG